MLPFPTHFPGEVTATSVPYLWHNPGIFHGFFILVVVLAFSTLNPVAHPPLVMLE